MGLFRRKKKREVIDFNEINQNFKIEEEIKEQEDIIIKNEIREEIIENIDFNLIFKNLKEINKDFETVIHEYFICKIFSRVALKDNEFNAQLIEIDKYINTFKRKKYDVERLMEVYRRDDSLDIKEIYFKVKDLSIYEKSIKQRFLEMNEAYYGHIKMSTLSVCLQKDNEELEKFYDLIHNFLSKHKGFTEAAESIYYTSGDFLVDLVNNLVLCIRETRKAEYIRKYNFSYFLESDVIITLDIKEWINLFNKVRFAFKLIQDIEVDKFLNFKLKYDQLETIYTILMMRHEIASGQGKAI